MPKKTYANEIFNVMLEYIKARGTGADLNIKHVCDVIASELDERRQSLKEEAWRRSQGWMKRTQAQLEQQLKEKLAD
jgi:hypothetical protein